MTSGQLSKSAVLIYSVLFLLWCMSLGYCPEFAILLAVSALIPIWKGPRIYRLAGFILLISAISGGITEYNAIKAQAERAREIVPINEKLQDADIIFHTSRSAQSAAIKKATHSPYTHMGIIFFDQSAPYVFEAVGPVKKTPLQEWVRRGIDGNYKVKRLKNPERLTPDAIRSMRAVLNQELGKPYDFTFEWSDDRQYCSELVWKIYQRGAGIELCPLRKFREFDLTSPEVKLKIRERFGDELPLEEPVVSPGDVYNSEILVRVRS